MVLTHLFSSLCLKLILETAGRGFGLDSAALLGVPHLLFLSSGGGQVAWETLAFPFKGILLNLRVRFLLSS